MKTTKADGAAKKNEKGTIAMAIAIGINGFGRIGRVIMRILANREDFEVCGIILRKADLDYMEYMLKYDTVFHGFPGTVEHDEEHLIVNGHKIRVFSETDAAQIPWSECGAEYIIESTGAFNTQEKGAAHFVGGAKKVIITAPAKDDITPTFVMGVNHETYTSDMNVVSNACPPSTPPPPRRRQWTPGQAGTGAQAAASWAISFPPLPARLRPWAS